MDALEKNALIVEDQIITALDIRFLLKGCGILNSTIINEGSKALDYIENENPTILSLIYN
jgi:CheY-like chemotaxis protein